MRSNRTSQRGCVYWIQNEPRLCLGVALEMHHSRIYPGSELMCTEQESVDCKIFGGSPCKEMICTEDPFSLTRLRIPRFAKA